MDFELFYFVSLVWLLIFFTWFPSSWKPAKECTTSVHQMLPVLRCGSTRSRTASRMPERLNWSNALPTSEAASGGWEQKRDTSSVQRSDLLTFGGGGTTVNQVPGGGGWIRSIHLSACYVASRAARQIHRPQLSDRSDGDEVKISWSFRGLH